LSVSALFNVKNNVFFEKNEKRGLNSHLIYVIITISVFLYQQFDKGSERTEQNRNRDSLSAAIGRRAQADTER